MQRIDTQVARTWNTNKGESLEELGNRTPYLIVFLRHSGCTFCRETMNDLAEKRGDIESRGVEIVLVHMMNDSRAKSFAEGYGLDDLPRISDPNRELYKAFELPLGKPGQLLGSKVLMRGIKAAVADGHWIGLPSGNTFQMPGTFLVKGTEILRAHRHRRGFPELPALRQALPRPYRRAQRLFPQHPPGRCPVHD